MRVFKASLVGAACVLALGVGVWWLIGASAPEDRRAAAWQACAGIVHAEYRGIHPAIPMAPQDPAALHAAVSIEGGATYIVRGSLTWSDDSGLPHRAMFRCRLSFLGRDGWERLDPEEPLEQIVAPTAPHSEE